jgi:hypothetical protein
MWQMAMLVDMQSSLAEKLKDTVTQLAVLQSRILDDELIRWKREQQLAGNGAKFNSNLDVIQEWYLSSGCFYHLISYIIFIFHDLLFLFGGDLEAGILSQPTGKFPHGARQPRLIVLATERKQSTLSTCVGARTIMGVR